MKITLISLMVLASFTVHAQEADTAVATAASTDIAAVMTPAEAPAKAEYEVSCRAQAKEVAANAYRSCISDGRNAQIEQLKKDYQEQIVALKAKYEAEIKALAGANAAALAATTAAANTEKPAAAPAAKATKAAAAPAVKAKKKPTAPVAGTKKSLNPGKAKAAPTKAAKAAVAAAAAAPAVSTEEIKEMTIELKPAAKTVGATDDSTMDIPEPIAVENN